MLQNNAVSSQRPALTKILADLNQNASILVQMAGSQLVDRVPASKTRLSFYNDQIAGSVVPITSRGPNGNQLTVQGRYNNLTINGILYCCSNRNCATGRYCW